MELMHYWCTRSYTSFTEEFGESLRDHITKEALRNEYLMDAVFALTSLHMATEAQDCANKDEIVSEALNYMNQAMAGLRSTLGALSPENCNAIFLTSISIMVCTIVSPLLQSSSSQTEHPTAEAMLKLVDFMKGCMSILDVSRPWLQGGPIGVMFESRQTRQMTGQVHFPFDETRQLNRVKERDPTLRFACDHAIDILERAVGRGRFAFVWLLNVQPDYLRGLREGDGVALAIYMQWGVLLDQFDDLWWARFCGKLLVDEISTALDKQGVEWIGLTGWSRELVGLHT